MDGLMEIIADNGGLNVLVSCMLSAVIIGIIAVGLKVDSRWIRFTPLTPLSVALFGIFIRTVIGPLLMSLGEGSSLGDKASVMIGYRSGAQLLWLIFTVSLVVPYLVLAKKFREDPRPGQLVRNENVIAVFAITTGLFSLAWIYTGLLTGSASRDADLYSEWVARFVKPDAIFIAFGRLRDAFYFLVPLALKATRKHWIRFAIIAIVTLNLTAALELGGRGIILIPIMEMYFGLFLLGYSKKLMVISTSLMLLVGLTGSQLLSGSHKFNVSSLSVSENSFKGALSSSGLVRTGIALYGCSDAYNFKVENITKPGAGWTRSERWLTAWLPSFVKGTSKGSARDAHIIAEQLEQGTSRIDAETKDYKSFSCVSFVGDLFWRWRWFGVAVGSSIFGFLYYAFTVGWRKVIGLNSLSGCLAICFPVSFLSLYPSGSVGETFWLWTWDVQKYLLLFFVLRYVDKRMPWRTGRGER